MSIVPIMSGYRYSALQLQITTFYAAALRRFADQGSKLDRNDFQVFLPKDQIRSAAIRHRGLQERVRCRPCMTRPLRSAALGGIAKAQVDHEIWPVGDWLYKVPEYWTRPP